MTLRIGSLATGYGGLDTAVQEVLDAELAWVSDIDPGACKILAHHFPDVPNLGDLTAVDWATVEPIHILTAGYPCQPFSQAGRRKGLDDPRHIWPWIADAIRHLRPRLVFLENVAGHLGLGFDAVLGDLASLGYDAQWVSLRAADVGAAHGRRRLFVAAYPRGEPRLERRFATPGETPRGWPLGEPAGCDRAPLVLLPTPAAGAFNDGEDPDQWEARRLRVKDATGNGNGFGTPLSIAVRLLPTPDAALALGGHEARGGVRSDELLLPGIAKAHATGRLLLTPCTTDANGAGAPEGQDYRGTSLTDATVRQPDRWGQYAAAIARAEAVHGPAPDPTEPGRHGKPRLAPRFVEWMMMLPTGHVTDVPGLSRPQQLHALGNGVVPPQGAAALRWLLRWLP